MVKIRTCLLTATFYSSLKPSLRDGARNHISTLYSHLQSMRRDYLLVNSGCHGNRSTSIYVIAKICDAIPLTFKHQSRSTPTPRSSFPLKSSFPLPIAMNLLYVGLVPNISLSRVIILHTNALTFKIFPIPLCLVKNGILDSNYKTLCQFTYLFIFLKN